MISLKRWRLFPRSLRQLVLLAFLLVLLPLLVLAYQAYQSLITSARRRRTSTAPRWWTRGAARR